MEAKYDAVVLGCGAPGQRAAVFPGRNRGCAAVIGRNDIIEGTVVNLILSRK